ncbi:putative Ig domain-containing protein [Cyanobium sp. ATX-6F1]|uniref:putative Ig domain-containing protein n=1 Tax=Cyanobium sp. ATX-6F1 TaxID=3137388 RepID=UPI0039BE93AE
MQQARSEAMALAATRQQGLGFSYQVPRQLLLERFPDVDLGGPSEATQPGGGALPSWLTYQPTSRTFTATNPPMGALPYRVQLQLTNRNGAPIQLTVEIAQP